MTAFARAFTAGLLSVLAICAAAQQTEQGPTNRTAGQGMMGQDRGQWMGPGMMTGPQGGMGPGMMTGPRGRMGPGMMSSTARMSYYMRNGVPAGYRGEVSPLAPTPEVVSDGARLYAENCASCHGAKGFGDGEAGRGLDPPPANLARRIRMPMLDDAYLLWTISEGGAPVGSAMPAYKDILSRQQMWKIVAAMRAGFPTPPRPGAPAATGSRTGDVPPEE